MHIIKTLFILTLLLSISALGADVGIVTYVYDGDTIAVTFEDGRTEIIRLLGVDCPEMDSEHYYIRQLAQESKEFTELHLYAERVNITYDVFKHDHYGRTLGYVFHNAAFFNVMLLEYGYAWLELQYPFRQDYRDLFKKAVMSMENKRRFK